MVRTFTKEGFHCFSLSASLAVGTWSYPGFERFVVCLHCSVEYLECRYSGFRSEGGKVSKLCIGIAEFSLTGTYVNSRQ